MRSTSPRCAGNSTCSRPGPTRWRLADVADPDAFTKTLDDAVDQYVADLRTLDKIAPEALHDAIGDVSRAMRRHDFAAALTARAPLDAFSAAECGAASTTDHRRTDRWVRPETQRGSSTKTGICRSVLAW